MMNLEDVLKRVTIEYLTVNKMKLKEFDNLSIYHQGKIAVIVNRLKKF